MTIQIKTTRLDDSNDVALIMAGREVVSLRKAGDSEDITLHVGQPILITELPNIMMHIEIIGQALNGAITAIKKAQCYDGLEDRINLATVNKYRAALASLGLKEED